MTTTQSFHGTKIEFDAGDRMRAALRRSGISVGEMAERLEVSRNTVSAWVNGRNTPRMRDLRDFAEIVDVQIDWIITGEWLEPDLDTVSDYGFNGGIRNFHGMPIVRGLSRLRESNSRPFHYKVNFAHQSLPDDLQNRPCPVCGAPLVWGVCTAVHAGDLALAA